MRKLGLFVTGNAKTQWLLETYDWSGCVDIRFGDEKSFCFLWRKHGRENYNFPERESCPTQCGWTYKAPLEFM